MNVLFKTLFIAFVAILLSGCLATGGGVYRDKHVTLGGVASNARPMPRPYYGGQPYYGQPVPQYYGQPYGYSPPPVVVAPAPVYQPMPHYAPPVVVIPAPRPPVVGYPHHHHQVVPLCSSRNPYRPSEYDPHSPCYWKRHIR